MHNTFTEQLLGEAGLSFHITQPRCRSIAWSATIIWTTTTFSCCIGISETHE